jgi:hypothetical protein
MEIVWLHFIKSGRSELVLGCQARVYVLPSPGKQLLSTITLIRCYMSFHLRYTSATRIHSHPTLMNLDKWTEVTMEDQEALPPRKFTTMHHEYMDLRTPEGLEGLHAIFPQGITIDRESLVDCLFLRRNQMAKDISQKIQVCPSAWWWHFFRQIRGYTE